VFILRESHAKNAFVSIIDGNKRTAYDTKKSIRQQALKFNANSKATTKEWI